MTKKIPYVFQRGNTYHFRIAIPKHLRGHKELPSETHIQKALGTNDIGKAEREGQKLAEEWKAKFDALSITKTVKVVGTLKLDALTDDLVHTGSRSDLLEYQTNFFPHIDILLNGLLSDGEIPIPSELNRKLNSTEGYLPKGSELQLDAPDTATQGELRTAIKAMQTLVHRCIEKVDAELDIHSAPQKKSQSKVPKKPTRSEPELRSNTLSVKDCLDEIIQCGERKPSTVEAYKKRLGWFLNTIKASINDNLCDVFTKKQMLAYKNKEISRGAAPQSIHNIFTTLRMISRYSHQEGYLTLNPCANIKLPEVKTTKHETEEKKLPYEIGEIQAIRKRVNELCESAGNWRSRISAMMTKVCIYTGCRIRESALMHGDDIDLENGTWSITDKRPDQELKTQQSARIIPLHPELITDEQFIKYVKEAQEDEDKRVFTAHLLTGQTITVGCYQSFVRNIKKPLEAEGIIKEAKRKDFHSLRRTFATQWNAQKLGAVHGEMYLGHQRSDMSVVGAGYDHHDYIEEMREAVGKLKL